MVKQAAGSLLSFRAAAAGPQVAYIRAKPGRSRCGITPERLQGALKRALMTGGLLPGFVHEGEADFHGASGPIVLGDSSRAVS